MRGDTRAGESPAHPSATYSRGLGSGRYALEFERSGLVWVTGVFSALVLVNLVTMAAGTQGVLSGLGSNPAGALLTPFVFDSWGTIGGLAGSVILFTPVLFGAPVSQRRSLSIFFATACVGVGELSAVLWDWSFGSSGFYASGASGFAIAALGILFGLSIQGLVRLGRQDTRSLGALSSYWWYSFMIVYLSLILTSLWFVIYLEPIFAPTSLYNWRVHEFAFILGAGSTVAFASRRWSSLGLDGKVRIDEMLANFHFDDLRGRFGQTLPKYHVMFKRPLGGEVAEFHPLPGEIWVSTDFEGRRFSELGPQFEGALLHAMVHAELFAEGLPWEPGRLGDRERFDEIAARVGAPTEP